MERSFAQAQAPGDRGGGQLPASQLVKQHAPDLRSDRVLPGNLLQHLVQTAAHDLREGRIGASQRKRQVRSREQEAIRRRLAESKWRTERTRDARAGSPGADARSGPSMQLRACPRVWFRQPKRRQ